MLLAAASALLLIHLLAIARLSADCVWVALLDIGFVIVP
jgi:hypothetical protein